MINMGTAHSPLWEELLKNVLQEDKKQTHKARRSKEISQICWKSKLVLAVLKNKTKQNMFLAPVNKRLEVNMGGSKPVRRGPLEGSCSAHVACRNFTAH